MFYGKNYKDKLASTYIFLLVGEGDSLILREDKTVHSCTPLCLRLLNVVTILIYNSLYVYAHSGEDVSESEINLFTVYFSVTSTVRTMYIWLE